MSSPLRSVAVYCGSSSGSHGDYLESANGLGQLIAQSGLRLIYGGGSVGLMGAIADAALQAGGFVHGVITEALMEAEVGHEGLSQLDVVATMHDRKSRMAALSDGFIGLPGGYGTYEELFEVLTWSQLGIHAKPVVLVNVRGYWDPLIAQVDRAVSDGFMRLEHRQVLRSADSPHAALALIQMPVPPPVPKWINK